MKRLASALLVSLCGCGSSEEKPEPTRPEPARTETSWEEGFDTLQAVEASHRVGDILKGAEGE